MRLPSGTVLTDPTPTPLPAHGHPPGYSVPAVRFGLFSLIYVVVGLLVAGGIVGNEDSYFSGLSNLEEIIEMVLAVLLWPLVLLDVNINIGDIDIGGGDGDSGGGSAGPAGDGGGGGK